MRMQSLEKKKKTKHYLKGGVNLFSPYCKGKCEVHATFDTQIQGRFIIEGSLTHD